MIDRANPSFARELPRSGDDAAELLAELVMIHAAEQMMDAPALDEDEAVAVALETLFGDVLEDALLVIVASHVDEAMQRIPEGFSRRLLIVTAGLHRRLPLSCASIPSRRYSHSSSSRETVPSSSAVAR